jgi:hypothetical protein
LQLRALAAPLFTALLLASCGGAGGGGQTRLVPAASGNPAPVVPSQFTLMDVQVAPYAVWADTVRAQPLAVTARTKSVGAIGLSLSYFDGLIGGSGTQITKPMFDDGTHGDAVAADGIWTLALRLDVHEPAVLRLYDGQVDALPITIQASDGSGIVAPTNSIEARLDVAMLDPALRGSVAATVVDASMLVTDSVVNLVDPTFESRTIARTTQRLYDVFAGDPFDFAVIFHTRTSGDGIPRSFSVENDVLGIGLTAFDQSAEYGSAGALQQVVFQNAHTLGLEINHELGHRWAAYLNKPALNLTLGNGVHWGPSAHVGQMGNGPFLQSEADGYRVTNADGSDHFVSNSYSNLELYLMGLAAADEVAPLRFVTDPNVDVRFGALLPEPATRLVTIDDIRAVYGARQPSGAAAPNAFSAAFVVVSDDFLTQAEYTLTTIIARYLAGTSSGGQRSGGLFEISDPPSFSACTGFRATLDTTLPPLP